MTIRQTKIKISWAQNARKISLIIFVVTLLLTTTAYGRYTTQPTNYPTDRCGDIIVVSDITNKVDDGGDGGGLAVATYKNHPLWTAVIPGATWIWKSFFVGQPETEATHIFSKNFDVGGEVDLATLKIAADNSYTVWINNIQIGEDLGKLNFTLEGQDEYDATSAVVKGNNTIRVRVTNFAFAISHSTPQLNPAGLLYRLEIKVKKDNCPGQNQRPVITVLGDNPLTMTAGDVFIDPGATAQDPEDSDLTNKIVVGGDKISTTTLTGSYTITYNVTDSDELKAQEQKRRVNVIPRAIGCQTPIITSPLSTEATAGSSFSYIITATSTATSTITFTVATSSLPAGLSFSTDTISGTPSVAGIFNIGITASNDCGVDTKTLSLTIKPKATNGGGGGGGGGSPVTIAGGSISITPIVKTAALITPAPALTIFDETIEKVPTANIVIIRWKSNQSATSLVFYGENSVNPVNSSLTNYGYTSGTPEDQDKLNSHAVIITGLKAGQLYFFRPASSAGELKAIGQELSLVLDLPPVCEYLHEFIKRDAKNNPEEVKKLQRFLRDFEGFKDLKITGVYDDTTLAAVLTFQRRYSRTILNPWGHHDSTGYIYLLTKKKINEIYCQKQFPLTETQRNEVISFRQFLEKITKRLKASVKENNGR